MPRAYDHRAGVDEARFAGRIDPAVQALFDRIRAQGTVLDATLWIYQEMARDHAAEPTSPAPYCSEALAARLAHQAWVSGDLISTGTDDFPPASDPWTGLDQEMLALQNAAGLPPLAVLRGATLVGARAVGREGEIGVLAPGALANMVFVRQNPLADVAAFKTVVLTVKRGKAYWRKDFQPIPADGASDPR
jgi:imidazolonepropionase-like amidohydrolase